MASTLNLAHKIGYGLGDLGINVFVIVKSLLVFDFLTAYLGVPPASAGLLTSLVLVFDILTDPLIAWASDRSETPWGRRAPFMMLGAVLMIAFLALMFAVPERMTGMAAGWWVTGFFAAASLGWTMIAIPYATLTMELTTDPHQRSVLTGFRMAGAAMGILLVGALFPALIGVFGADRGAFLPAMLCFAPVTLLAVSAASWAGLQAKNSPAPTRRSLWQAMRIPLANKPFMVLVTTYGLQTLAISLITVGIPHAARYLVQTTDGSPLPGAQTLIFASFVIGAMASQPLWVWASKRLGKARAYMLAVLFYSLVLWGLFSILPTTALVLLLAVIVFAGLANGAYQQIPWALMPDLADQGTRNKPQADNQGAYMAYWFLGQKVANALGPLIFGFLLASFDFQASKQGYIPQSETALAALKWGMTLLPAGILLASVPLYVFMSRRFMLDDTSSRQHQR